MGFVFGNVMASLSTLLAGEDLTNNRLMVASYPDQVVILTAGTSVAANASVVSSTFNMANYRKFSIIAIGYSGPLNVHLDISPNAGGDYIGGMNDASGQYVYVPPADCCVGLGRLTIRNTYTSAQNFNAWVTLAR